MFPDGLTPEQEEAVNRRLLPCLIDGTTYKVPELTWRQNEVWQDTIHDTLVGLASVQADTPAGHRAMFHAELDLVRAYDRTGVLPLDDATAREVHAIYDAFLEVSFPLAESVTALLTSAVTAAVQSVRESLSSSPSPTGTSPATHAMPSPIAKRSSTSARHRTA